MLILSGRVSALKEKPWAGIELVSDARLEECVLHIVNWSVKKLRGAPFQLLFPVKSRDLPNIRMLSPYLFVRTNDLEQLREVSSIYGVEGLVTGVDGKLLPFDNQFVQSVILESRKAAEGWSEDIRKGSFVRVLLGREHMLCGTVRRISVGIADVDISLRLRVVRLTTPVAALLNLDYVSKRRREYYYSGEK